MSTTRDPGNEATRVGDMATILDLREQEKWAADELGRQEDHAAHANKLAGRHPGRKSEAAHLAELARQKQEEAARYERHAEMSDSLPLTADEQLARRREMESWPVDRLAAHLAHWRPVHAQLAAEEERLIELQRRVLSGRVRPGWINTEQLESEGADFSEIAAASFEAQNTGPLLAAARRRLKRAKFEIDAAEKAQRKQEQQALAAAAHKDAQKLKTPFAAALRALEEHLLACHELGAQQTGFNAGRLSADLDAALSYIEGEN